MLGTLINAAAIVAGGAIGLMFKKNLPKRFSTIYFQAVGLFTIILGIQMSIGMQKPLMVVFSLILGGLTGEWLKLQAHTTNLGNLMKKRFRLGSERFTEGLVTSFLLFCMGSMTLIGSMQEGLGIENPSNLLVTKSLMDFFSAIMLASALGVGVLFSAVPLLIFQGGITLLVMLFGTGIPDLYINELVAISGIMMIGLGIVIMDIKELRIINLLPSLVFLLLFLWIEKHAMAFLNF
ncbi:MAG: DUF554 domain-containing protein [Prevotellaceae bacterium]|jgi:uncharacterized membrane protein YqgA involved in biofilm formation|nr:DUF554 domain-containing protein [Prevotellaceae bacterium]